MTERRLNCRRAHTPPIASLVPAIYKEERYLRLSKERERHKAVQDQMVELKGEQYQLEKKRRTLEDRGKALGGLEQFAAGISERLDNAPFHPA